MSTMPNQNLLIYLLRRDLRIKDNPVFHSLKDNSTYTHLLPVYIFAAQQIEVSGFIKDSKKSPYPEARSAVGGFWRCGPHRARFLAESVWDLKGNLNSIGSDLDIRVGMVGDVVKYLIEGFEKNHVKVGGVWMTGEEGVEEKMEESEVRNLCNKGGLKFELFKDEKYFVDE